LKRSQTKPGINNDARQEKTPQTGISRWDKPEREGETRWEPITGTDRSSGTKSTWVGDDVGRTPDWPGRSGGKKKNQYIDACSMATGRSGYKRSGVDSRDERNGKGGLTRAVEVLKKKRLRYTAVVE